MMKNHTVPVCLYVCILLGCSTQAETLLNQRTSLDQKSPAAAMSPSGRSLAVWSSYQHDGNSGAIVARWISADGTPDSNEWLVNQQTEGNQCEPAVAINDQGICLVTWRGPHTSAGKEEVIAQRLNADGMALGEEFIVNQNTADAQLNPAVCAQADGSFFVAWESESAPGHNKRAICGRIIDANGMLSGPERILSDTPSYECRDADISGNPAGGIKVVWLENRSKNAIRLRSFRGDGTPERASVQVNTGTFKTLTVPSLCITPEGQSVVVWDGDPNTGLNDDIYARLLDANDSPLSAEFIANQRQAGYQRNPSAAAMPNGDCLIAWESESLVEDHSTDISVRRFSPDGSALCDEYTVNQTLLENQSAATISTNATNQYLLLWQSRDPDSKTWDIMGQVGPQLHSADLNLDGSTDFQDYALWAQSWPHPCQRSVDLFQDFRLDSLDLWGMCQQWLPTLD